MFLSRENYPNMVNPIDCINKIIVAVKKYYNVIPAEFFTDHYCIPSKYFYTSLQEFNNNSAETSKVFEFVS